MNILTIQILAIVLTFGRHRFVIARSLSQRTSSKDETSCLIDGDSYPVNSSFITSNCSRHCYCFMGGLAFCYDLCPKRDAPCPPGYSLQVFEEAVGSGGVHCSCKRQRCVPDDPAKVVCYRRKKDEKYKVGETFTLGNCSRSCRCNENGKISCVPMCPRIKCPRGMRPRVKDVAVRGENGCSCQTQECVTVPRRLCYVDGRRFRRRHFFITKDCKSKCRCRKNGKTRCTPLCKKPQNVPECDRDEKLTVVLALFAGGRCSCENKVCLPSRRDNWIENGVGHLEHKN